MKTKTHFAFRIDVWDSTGDNLVEHVAGGRLRGDRSDLPGSRGPLASGTHYPTGRASGWCMTPADS
jgi:hypothetical protein